MSRNGNNKLPSYGIEMSILENEKDEKGILLLESMPLLGVIDVEQAKVTKVTTNENWRKWYPIWQNPQALALQERKLETVMK
jgi:hypothetical protein